MIEWVPLPSEEEVASIAREAGWRAEEQSLEMFLRPFEPPSGGIPPWKTHGSTFIRSLLHLSARFAAVDSFVPLELLNHGGGLWFPTSLYVYRDRLEGELSEYRGSIRELLKTPAPAAFATLFEADVRFTSRGS